MAITWLADALRAAGVAVVEHPNWKTYDRPGTWDPRFIVVHATAAPRTQPDATQVAIVRNGRADLNGPIANACVDRAGKWHVLSAGRCNTTLAGTAGPFEGMGNTNALGIEACNDNGLATPAEAWPDVQYQSYVSGVAAICKKMGWTSGRAVGHKEHCPGRKSDPTFNMATFRANVTKALNGADPMRELAFQTFTARLPILKRGDNDGEFSNSTTSWVGRVQRQLRVDDDGDYGANTAAAVAELGLPGRTGNVVDIVVWEKLYGLWGAPRTVEA